MECSVASFIPTLQKKNTSTNVFSDLLHGIKNL